MTTVEAVPWTDRSPERGPAPGPHGPAPERSAVEGQRGTVEPGPLYRRFVKELVSERLELAGADATDVGDRTLDWHAIWASGEGAATPEEAVGRVILAAHRATTGRALGRATVPGPAPAVTGAVPDATASNVVGPGEWPISHGVTLLDRELAPMAGHLGTEPEHPVLPAQGPLIDVPVTQTAAIQFPVVERPAQEVRATAIAPPIARGVTRFRRRQKLANAFGWVRNIGIVIILFAAWQLWGTSIAQHQAQLTLRAQFRSHAMRASPPTGGVHLIGADVRVPEPAEGSVVAYLQIPSIGVDQYVVEGTAEGDLAKGPGHYIGTAMPGQAGNVAIAGHRTTYGAPFNELNELSPGDSIVLSTDSGESLDYVVTQPPVAVSPNDVAVLNAFGDNRLTLTTCNPKYSATQRLVVLALLREPSGSGPVAVPSGGQGPSRQASHVIEGGSGEWNLLYLPPVLLVVALLVLLGFANQRASGYFGRRGRWLILVPMWLAGLYVLFGFLTSFLPATL